MAEMPINRRMTNNAVSVHIGNEQMATTDNRYNFAQVMLSERSQVQMSICQMILLLIYAIGREDTGYPCGGSG